MNSKGPMESRKRDEGMHAKHIREDGGVPITGKKGAAIHGEHTGEMADCKTGMCTDSGKGVMTGGRGAGKDND